MSKSTKETILQAAVQLFNVQGYTGTSLRDIAKKANVNVSNIAYYFENKRGLLEYGLTMFFEGYMKVVEEGYYHTKLGARGRLKQITENILLYQSQNLPLTRFVLREVSIDSQVIREIMSTYVVKERYYFKNIFEEGIRSKEFKSFSINYMIIQYKSLISMPFLNSYYLAEVLQILPQESYFVKKYSREINHWIDQVLCLSSSDSLDKVIP